MKKALVTGGCGFLGSSIVRRLRERDIAVRILAVPGESTENVDDLLGDAVEVIRGDVRSAQSCREAVAGVDTVFHAAAIYKAYMPDPTAMYEVNIVGTVNMLQACREAGVGTVVYTASIVALGRSGEEAIGDESTPYDAWDIDFAYSRSKYHSRVVAEAFADWGVDVRVVCPGIVFGPGDKAPTPSGKLILEALNGGPPIYMDGGAAYVDVRDAAEVHVLAAEKGQAGERYLAVGHNLSNREFMEAIGRAVGEEKRLFKLPVGVARTVVRGMNAVAERRGKEPRLPQNMFDYSCKAAYFDNSRSRLDLGATYRPIEESIRDAVEYFRRTGQA